MFKISCHVVNPTTRSGALLSCIHQINSYVSDNDKPFKGQKELKVYGRTS